MVNISSIYLDKIYKVIQKYTKKEYIPPVLFLCVNRFLEIEIFDENRCQNELFKENEVY